MSNTQKDVTFKPFVEVLTWNSRQDLSVSAVSKKKVRRGYFHHVKAGLRQSAHDLLKFTRNESIGHAALKFTLPDTPEIREKLEGLKDNIVLTETFAYIGSNGKSGAYLSNQVPVIEVYFSWWPDKENGFEKKVEKNTDLERENDDNLKPRKNIKLSKTFTSKTTIIKRILNEKTAEKELKCKILNRIIKNKISLINKLDTKKESKEKKLLNNDLDKLNASIIKLEKEIESLNSEINHLKRYAIRFENHVNAMVSSVGRTPDRMKKLPLSTSGAEPNTLDLTAMLDSIKSIYDDKKYQGFHLGKRGENCASSVTKIIVAGSKTSMIANQKLLRKTLVKGRLRRETPTSVADKAQILASSLRPV
jgi:hypothetical protein